MPLDQARTDLLIAKVPKQYGLLLDVLEDEEDLSAAAPVVMNVRLAVIGLTERRLIIVKAGRNIFSQVTWAEVHLEHVVSVHLPKRRVRSATSVIDAMQSYNEVVIESRSGDYSVSFAVPGIDKYEAARWPNMILGMQSRLINRSAIPETAASALNGGLVGDIERLADLRQRGLLTEEEFTAAKGRLFGQRATEAAVPTDDSSTCRQYLVRAEGRLRKDALSVACVNQVMNLPVASGVSFGHPLVPKKDLRPAVETVRRILRQDASMAAWVARATLVSLDLFLESMRGTWDEAFDIAMSAAGLVPGPGLDPTKLAGLSDREQEDTLGTAQCALSVFLAFERPERGVLGDRTYYKHVFESTSRATRMVAHEVVAWASVVIGRLVNSGHAQEVLWMSPAFESVPTMDSAGWYPNPFNAGKIVDGLATWQRYWNADWTDRVRVLRDGLWMETTWSIFRVPDN